MLQVDFKRELGWFTAVEKHSDGEHKFKIKIHPCNALAAFVHHYISKADHKKCAMLYAFFCDKTHMRRIEKDHWEHTFFDIKGAVRLNTAHKDYNVLAGFFLRQGHTIKPYYKPSKKK